MKTRSASWLNELARRARTIRHLRPSQVWWRGRYWIQRRLPPKAIRAPATVEVDASWSCPVPVFHRAGAQGREAVRQLAEGEFQLLNQGRPIGRERPDWRLGPQATDRLWTITLHYHEWVYALAEVICGKNDDVELADQLFVEYVSDWMARCDLTASGARDLAWNSYAVSTRIGWWIRAYQLLGERWWEQRGDFRHYYLTSLWRQAEFLSRHLEWDLRANHLLRNTVGLAWAGRFFRGDRPDRWLRMATELGVDQLREQVLDDGGHFERSPMYHLHAMEDVLLLSRLLSDDAACTELTEVWQRMAEFLRWMRHPDGEIAPFNDANLSGACPADEMLQHAETLCDVSRPQGGRWFRETGLVVWHGEPWTVFFDVGEIGPSYQPGHAHADTLTLECSYGTDRLFIDPGTFAYDLDDRRRYDRSTAAHNTVCVDGENSSEVWHIFRIGRRARPIDVDVQIQRDGMTAAASHTGYDRLPGSPRHSRRLQIADGGALELVDRVDGSGRHTVEGGYLLHPDWSPTAATGGWFVQNGRQQVRVAVHSRAHLDLSVELRPVHPAFGREVETRRLAWRWQGELPLEVKTVVETCPAAFDETNSGQV